VSKAKGGVILDVTRTVAGIVVAVCIVVLATPIFDGLSNAAVAAELSLPSASRPSGFADVVQRIRPAVISIWVRAEEDAPTHGRTARRIGTSSGSGFLISADGYAVTNAHVIKPEHTIPLSTHVATADGSIHNAKLVGMDPLTDLALIKVEGRSDFPFVTFAETTPRVGDWVIAIGSPFGLQGTVTTGIVSAEGRDIGYGPYNDFIQIDAPTNQGSSGGPAFDLDGKVIGVNTALWRTPGASGFLGIAFAIPADTVKTIIAQLKEHGSVTRGWIDVQVQPVTHEVADRLGLKTAAGALVAERRSRKGPATAINSGDVITSINGQAVRDSRDFARRTGAMAPGTRAELGVLRKGEEKVVTVKLGKLPDQPPLAPN
jgi:serine protease Do